MRKRSDFIGSLIHWLIELMVLGFMILVDPNLQLIPFLKDYIALAVLRKYANEVILAIADFGYLPRISLNCCCICANV